MQGGACKEVGARRWVQGGGCKEVCKEVGARRWVQGGACGAPLVKARQPAQALEVLQVDVRGVGILSDGRSPPERRTPTTTRGVDRLERTNGHAAGGHDGEPEPAVIDLDDVDAFLPAAVQRAFLDGPRLVGCEAAAGCLNAPVVHMEVQGDRGEDLSHAAARRHASLLARLAAVAPRARRRPGSVGSSNRRAGAERSAQHGRLAWYFKTSL